MRIDMQKPDGPLPPHGFQDGLRDRMIAANANRHNACVHHAAHIIFDVGMALLETVAALHRDIADIGNVQTLKWRAAQHMLEGADALHGAHSTWSQSGTGAVRDTKIHRHAIKRDIKAYKMIRQSVGLKRRAAKRRRVSEGPFAPFALKLPLSN